jgi:hypothetical protein
MGVNRVFLPQEMLDVWLTEDRVEVDGETMVLKPEGQKFRLKTALRFLAEVADGGDDDQLVGKVKDLDQVTELGGEHHATSVILGDNAYDVVEGFVGEPVFDAEPAATGTSLAGATRAVLGDDAAAGEIDLLAKFFLSGK